MFMMLDGFIKSGIQYPLEKIKHQHLSIRVQCTILKVKGQWTIFKNGRINSKCFSVEIMLT